ncbi:hypothetical protein JGU66_27760 [Myxococcaceae bacterium JPH2]|nr:hypothetical protein [Myxococcaceae bacterium JPH2]
MNALPPALRPWARQLALLPEDASASLGHWLMRLSAAIGPVGATNEVVRGGEPEGYDGLTRRGPLERLLTSEWLWALEAPDELVRRAAMGELAFLQRSYQQPKRTRRSVVLLDVGPDQLGLPRLAQLAVLLTLARRAEAAGVAFAWALLQHSPQGALFEVVTEESLRAWSEARTLDTPTPSRLAEWREVLALGSDELWLVGASRLGQLPEAQGAFRVEISEPIALGTRALHVDVKPPTRSAQRLVLELPAQEVCVRLLRSPLRARAPKPVTTATRLRGFAFSGNGRRLVLFREDNAVLSQIIPNSVNATVPKPRGLSPRPGETVVAAGWRGDGGLLLLTCDEAGQPRLRGQLRCARGLRQVHFAPDVTEHTPLRASSPTQLPGRLLSYLDAKGQEQLLVVEVSGKVFRTRSTDKDAVLGLDPLGLGTVVASIRVEPNDVVLLAWMEKGGPSNPKWSLSLVRTGREGSMETSLPAMGSRAFFGWTPKPFERPGPLLAFLGERDTWQVGFEHSLHSITVPKEVRVMGACLDPAEGKPRLLVLEPNQRTFSFMGVGGSVEVVMEAPGRVLQAEVSHGVAVLGWRTEDGLGVWDLNARQTLLRLSPELR